MAVYIVTGRLGAGKGLFCAGVARDYLLAGRVVATNMDLFLEHLLPASSRATVTRVPDKPRASDLVALGYGCAVSDYSGRSFGALILDELGTWFNSRSWQDKERMPVIDWMLHARKFRWDVYLMVQELGIIDAQLRDALCEYHVVCRGTQTLAVPVLGQIARVLGFKLTLPKGSVATVRYGQDTSGPVIDRKWYRSKDLYKAYDTGQIFKPGTELMGRETAELVDMRCLSSVLSAWHIKGRYSHPKHWSNILDLLFLLVAGVVVVLFAAVTRRSLVAAAAELGIKQGINKPVLVKPTSIRDSIIFDSDKARGSLEAISPRYTVDHVPTFVHVDRHRLVRESMNLDNACEV